MSLMKMIKGWFNFWHWERLRRIMREPILDRSGVALFTLLGGLLLLAGRDPANQGLAGLDTGNLAAAMAGFLVFFLTGCRPSS